MVLLRFTVFVLLICAAGRVVAAPVTITLTAGHRSADVAFDVSGANLIITLTNSSPADVTAPDQLLNALFFNSSVALDLTPVSVTLAPGSTVLFGPQPAGGDVSGEWAYNTFTPSQYAYGYGISSTGLGLFDPHDRFDTGENLAGPASPGGMEYGITSAGDDPLTGNMPVTGQRALIRNAVMFMFVGVPVGFDPMQHITGIQVQYGTNLSEPRIATPDGDIVFTPLVVVPAPPAFASGMVLLGLVAVVTRWRRRRTTALRWAI